MADLTPDQLDNLEAIAEEATPGPWRFGDWAATFGTRENPWNMLTLERNLTHPGPEPYIRLNGDDVHLVLSLEDPAENKADAKHIAAASPDVVLALVADARKLAAIRALAADGGLTARFTLAKIKEVLNG